MRKALITAMAVTFVCSFATAKEIRIGAIMPLSGQIAAYGQTAYEGVVLANKMEPTLKNGDTLRVIFVDTKGDKIESANAASRLITSEKVSAIIGELISTNTEQVASVAEKNKIPVVAPAATNDRLVLKKDYLSRVCFTDSFQGEVAASYAYNKLGHKTAVIILDQAQVYSIGLAKTFEDKFTQLGGKIVKYVRITSGDKDFKAAVSQLKSLNPDFVFLPLYHPEASMIARQVKEAGLKLSLMSGDGVANDTFLELGKEAVEGYMFTDTFDFNAPPTKRSHDFIDAYEKEKGKRSMASFTALGADSYFLIVDAMNRCEDPTDSVCVNKEIKATKNFEGVSGIINMTEEGNAIRSAVIKVVKNGVFEYQDTVNP